MPPKKTAADTASADLSTVTGDAASPDVTASNGPVGYVIRCHRDRGIWRAGRFWTPDSIPVAAEDLTAEQLVALQDEPLLSVLPAQE